MTENKDKNDAKNETIITPWAVESNDKMSSINYDHVIDSFGCTRYDTLTLNQKLKNLTGIDPHRFLRRSKIFAHRDFDKLINYLDLLIKDKDGFKEKNDVLGKKVYLYTGRGPSTSSMHIGHTLPFLITKYFQDLFKCKLVIQITDDEKFYFKENIKSIETVKQYCKENIKDIISFGFDPELTYIFINSESRDILNENVTKLSKITRLSEVMAVFGFNGKSNVGMVGFPVTEMAPAFSSTFDFIEKDSICLISAAIDQDPYFRMTRDKAVLLKEKKPSSLYIKLLPDLTGTHKKMSSSSNNENPRSEKSSKNKNGEPIFLNDSMETIKRKINKNAFSGGGETLDLHRQNGGNCDIDIPFQYLTYFLESDEELEQIRIDYSSGKMTTGEIKAKCIEVVQEFVKDFQSVRATLDDELFEKFMSLKK